MGNGTKRTIQVYQRKVYKKTNLKDLLTNTINKSRNRHIRLCIRSVPIIKTYRWNIALSRILQQKTDTTRTKL